MKNINVSEHISTWGFWFCCFTLRYTVYHCYFGDITLTTTYMTISVAVFRVPRFCSPSLFFQPKSSIQDWLTVEEIYNTYFKERDPFVVFWLSKLYNKSLSFAFLRDHIRVHVVYSNQIWWSWPLKPESNLIKRCLSKICQFYEILDKFLEFIYLPLPPLSRPKIRN